MSMENIRVLNQNVNPTVTEVCQWLTKKAECGDIPESSARLGAIALKQLAANPRLIIPGHDPEVFVKFPKPGNGVARLD